MLYRSVLFLLALVALPMFSFGDNAPFFNEIPIHEAYATKFQAVAPPNVILKKPPAEKIQNIPPKPTEDAFWIAGYWAWVSEINDYKWICGVWRRPPPNHEWVSGSWIKNKEGWSWLQGFWNLLPEEKLSFNREAPPIRVNDNPSPAPNKDSFWAFGYWKYLPESKSYGWIEGTWQKFDPNWVLAPANYIWRPNGYVLVPPYWDFPIEKRGAIYTCTYPINKITTDTVLQSCFSHYPDYLNWFQHFWHFNKSWWKDCWCTPPWWNWDSWWTFTWQDQWALWWWYTHPGFAQPDWMTAEISDKMTPPNEKLVELMKQVKVPEFFTKIETNDKALKPSASENAKEVIRPLVTVDVKPVGKVEVPTALPPPKPIPPKVEPKPLPIDLPRKSEPEKNPMEDPNLTPLLDSDRPNYSNYEPLYEYKYQPEYRYRPEYYYKPYKEDNDYPPK